MSGINDVLKLLSAKISEVEKSIKVFNFDLKKSEIETLKSENQDIKLRLEKLEALIKGDNLKEKIDSLEKQIDSARRSYGEQVSALTYKIERKENGE